MPNTPALVRAGISALYANSNVSEDQRELAETIMSAVGKMVWIEDESLMDTVTAVSGSGPAYFFYVMQAIQDAAVAEGLDADTARLLALETALGAARLAVESTEDPGTLQERVTSPGGTTEAAINVLDASGVAKAFGKAVSAARARGGELAKLLD
jgi:pyrroline-5-carboxylate reductase